MLVVQLLNDVAQFLVRNQFCHGSVNRVTPKHKNRNVPHGCSIERCDDFLSFLNLDAELFGRVITTLKQFLRVIELEVSQKGLSVLTMDTNQVIVVHGEFLTNVAFNYFKYDGRDTILSLDVTAL
jgi:hypothetical protein